MCPAALGVGDAAVPELACHVGHVKFAGGAERDIVAGGILLVSAVSIAAVGWDDPGVVVDRIAL